MIKNAALIGAGGLALYGLYLASQPGGQVIDLTPGAAPGSAPGNFNLNDAANSAGDYLEKLTMGIFNIGNMNRAKPEMLAIPNVRAMLAVIRKGEGTSDAAGYGRIFGGRMFTDFTRHPNILIKAGGYKSTAAGAYQFLYSTWKETAAKMGLKDFSPASQDLGALGRIAARGALDDVIAGRFYIAINKMGKEWASLPGSPYGQPVQTIQGATAIYLASNGNIAAA